MDTAEILALLQDVAARVITPRFRHLDDDDIAEKHPGDLVTVADREAEALITAALTDAYPDAVVLGEEAVETDPGLLDRFAAAGHGFTVDPVDGTKNFVHGSPDHAVMAAELVDGVITRSWIWQPQHELAFVAEAGGGATCNGEPLHRTEPPADPAAWRVVTSRSRWLRHALPGLRRCELTWVCCGVDYPHLLAGDADVVLYATAKPWDHAPGALLLAEAGAHVGLMDGSAYDARHVQRGLIAAADRSAYDDVVVRVRDAGWAP